MLLIYQRTSNSLAHLFIIFMCFLGSPCHGLYDKKPYKELLGVISCINENNSIAKIVLHGSVAWKYNIADATRNKVEFNKLTINDLDFFIPRRYFYTSIDTLKQELPELQFKIIEIIEFNTTWCACFFRTPLNKIVRVADFVKLSADFDDADILHVRENKISFTIARAKWMIEYEKKWINNLREHITKYSDYIEESGNAWLALSENSDLVYAIYKTINKYNEHIIMLDTIFPYNEMKLKTELDPIFIKEKCRLDNLIFNKNEFLSKSWGINITPPSEDKSTSFLVDTAQNHKPPSHSFETSEKATSNIKNKSRKKRNSKNNQKTLSRISEKNPDSKTFSPKTKLVSIRSNYFSDDLLNKKSIANNHQEKIHKIKDECECECECDILNITNTLSSLSINKEEDLEYEVSFDNDNPFTYSFHKTALSKQYKTHSLNKTNPSKKHEIYSFHETDLSKKLNIKGKKSSSFIEGDYNKTMINISLGCYISFFTFLLCNNIPVEPFVEMAAMVISSFSELFLSATNFALTSDYNWMAVLPAILTMICIKYKKREKRHMLALGLFLAYSSVNTYMAIAKENTNIQPCPLPDWLENISHIPHHDYVYPVTRKISPQNTWLLSPQKWTSSDKLSCDMIAYLDEKLKSIVESDDFYDNYKISALENCGFIDDDKLSNLCYNFNWYNLRNDLLKISTTNNEQCDNNYCISDQPLIVYIYGEFFGEYEPCCVENQGMCNPIIFSNNNTHGITTVNYTLNMQHLDDKLTYLLHVYDFSSSGASWKKIKGDIKGGKDIVVKEMPPTGIFTLSETKTHYIRSIMCLSNGKFARYDFE